MLEPSPARSPVRVELNPKELARTDKSREFFLLERSSPHRIVNAALALHKVISVYRTTLEESNYSDISENPALKDSVNSVRKLSSQGGSSDEAGVQARRVFDWFSDNNPGSARLLTSLIASRGDDGQVKVDTQRRQELEELIGINVSWFVRSKTERNPLSATRFENGGSVNEGEQAQLLRLTQFLVKNSPAFAGLQGKIDLSEEALDSRFTVENLVGDFIAEEKVRDEIGLLSETAGIYRVREWIRQTLADFSEKGQKVSLTPYYSELLAELDAKSRAKNGVGGVILHGPPGTGKSEILKKNAEDQGILVRVVNIHYWTNFTELIADRALQLGVDKGAGKAEKIKAVMDVLGGDSPENFGKQMEELFSQLKTEGKISGDVTINHFLSSLTSPEAQSVLENEEFSVADWETIQKAFIQREKTRLLRTTLAPHLQESYEDIVKGEILLAIQNDERVILDEIDKAGPSSMGGILTFLAQSPGSTFTVGSTSVTIPSWFKVDATSNASYLEDYLKNRFSAMEVKTPPVKDQLMIASLRVADERGNVLLSEHEQYQLIGFFTYIVPELNKVLIEGGFSPLSNRDIQRFASHLVDYGTKKRTDTSFEQALKKFLTKDQLWEQFNDKMINVPKEVEKLLDGFSLMIKDRPVNLGENQASIRVSSLRRLSREAQSLAQLQTQKNPDEYEKVRKEHLRRLMRDDLDKYQATVYSSPLLTAISGLESQSSGYRQLKAQSVTLSDTQSDEVARSLASHETGRKDLRKLFGGLILMRELVKGNSEFKLASLEGGKQEVLARSVVVGDLALEGCSADGKVLVLSSGGENGRPKTVKLAEVFNATQSTEAKDLGVGSQSEIEVKVDGLGERIIAFAPKNKVVNLIQTENGVSHTISDVVSINISRDSRKIIVERSDKNTRILDGTGKVVYELKGTGWEFAGDHLLVRKVGNQVQPQAFLVN